MQSSVSIPVVYAYNIDSKIDDGLPLAGNVVAYYVSSSAIAAAANAVSASASTCFDTTSGNYSIGTNGGKGPNCAISVRLQ